MTFFRSPEFVGQGSERVYLALKIVDYRERLA
jgi:hypothetical protein